MNQDSTYKVGQIVCIFSYGDLLTMVIREIDEKNKIIKGLYNQEYHFDQIVSHITRSCVEYLFHNHYRNYSGDYADHQSFIKVDAISKKQQQHEVNNDQ